jgi:hypothetical protein
VTTVAHAGLTTDQDAPFRFDTVGHEAGGTFVVPPPTAPAGSAAPVSAAPTRPAGPDSGWTGGRIVALVLGSLLVLVGLGDLVAGGAGLRADQHRDGGFLTSAVDPQHTDAYAITSDHIRLDVPGVDWRWTGERLGTIRIRVTGTVSEAATFVGIARTDRADRYLGVPRTVLPELPGRLATIVDGAEAPAPPSTADIWVAGSSGPGTRTPTWEPIAGDWTVVVMNANAGRGVTAWTDVGATMPALTGMAIGLLASGAVLVSGGAILVMLVARRAGERR